jgi:hypothetical protein
VTDRSVWPRGRQTPPSKARSRKAGTRP